MNIFNLTAYKRDGKIDVPAVGKDFQGIRKAYQKFDDAENYECVEIWSRSSGLLKKKRLKPDAVEPENGKGKGKGKKKASE